MKLIKILSILLLFNICVSQINHPYPPSELVTIPTAGTLPRGSYAFETLLIKNGGLVSRLSVGFTDHFSFGVSFGVQNFIGSNNPTINKPTPEVQIKYRLYEESEQTPAFVVGLDTQGKGEFIEFIGENISNRYDQKAWGIYAVASKNWSVLGNLGFHIGLNKNYWESTLDKDSDVNLFFGFDKELNRSFSFLIEYDAAINDNSYETEDITFGKGRGYLNAGIRWTFAENLLLELNANDLQKNSKAGSISREIKIIFSESF